MRGQGFGLPPRGCVACVNVLASFMSERATGNAFGNTCCVGGVGTLAAEKFQAMVYLGTINSRMKDFYDIWLLSRRFDFDGATLAEAVLRTFAHRDTKIDLDPVCFRDEFFGVSPATTQWQAFLTKGSDVDAPPTLAEVADQLRNFLLPLVEAVGNGRRFEGRWAAPGPWK